ncbi:MAG: hypothetical protein WD081_06355 [Gammaproteobacteria bacterium]
MRTPPHGIGLGGKPRGVAERVLSRDERAERDEIHARAERLSAAFVEVERALRDVGHEPDEFAALGQSWVAILAGEEIAVAVHKRDEASVTRIDLLGTSDVSSLLARIELAEQALLRTPLDCESSHGVLDPGIRDEDGNRLLYALTLADRRESLVWGLHYRFTATDGVLNRVERLHYRCAISTIKAPPRADGRPSHSLDRRSIVMMLPGTDLPTETHLLQLHLYPEYPYEVSMWTRNKVFHFGKSREIPVRYLALDNPCIVAED